MRILDQYLQQIPVKRDDFFFENFNNKNKITDEKDFRKMIEWIKNGNSPNLIIGLVFKLKNSNLLMKRRTSNPFEEYVCSEFNFKYTYSIYNNGRHSIIKIPTKLSKNNIKYIIKLIHNDINKNVHYITLTTSKNTTFIYTTDHIIPLDDIDFNDKGKKYVVLFFQNRDKNTFLKRKTNPKQPKFKFVFLYYIFICVPTQVLWL